MLTSVTTVVERRTRFTADGATVPFEAGWASEALFFLQVEPGHPALTVTPEISPDGLAWLAGGESQVIQAETGLAAVRMQHFGTWVRLRLEGASEASPVVLLVHLTLKG